MTTVAETQNDNETTLFRGPSLEELLPQIREKLGPHAVVVRRRDGVTGGVGGFFQRRCVEVEARAGGPRVDTYDDPDEAAARAARPLLDPAGDAAGEAAIGEGLRAPAIRALVEAAAPFAEQLAAAEEAAGEAVVEQHVADAPSDERDERDARPSPAAAADRRPRSADTIEAALVDGGLSAGLARTVVAETVSHLLPFGTPRQLRRLVRRALARRIPVQPLRGSGGAVLAFAGAGGSGKTLMVARLAAAYAAGSDVPVAVVSLRPSDGGERLRALLAPAGIAVHAATTVAEARAGVTSAGKGALVLVDTPAVSPADAGAAAELGADLAALGAEVQLCVPATLGAGAARALLDGLQALRPAALAITHLDESPTAGAPVELAMAGGPPLSLLATGAALDEGLDVADPAAVAALLLR